MTPPTGDNIWFWLISAILTGGGGKFLYDSFRDWRNQPGPDARRVATIDASIITVARARDELEEDNARLRAMIGEERARWDLDRAAWTAERLSLRAEIEELRAQIWREREESRERYDSLLARLSELSARHAPKEGTA